MRNYKELKVWQKAMDMVEGVYRLTKELPEVEKFGLVSQINRAAVSVPANIAEGCGRGTDKELSRFLGIALASAFELETQILLTVRLNYIKEEKAEQLLSLLDEVQKMLGAFINKLRSR